MGTDPTTAETLAAILARLAKIEAALKLSDHPVYLTAEQAAAYLGISYSTFRKKARLIHKCPQTGRYRREDLDQFAESRKPRKKR